jgi:hypothetical protein
MHAGLIPIVSYEASVDIEDFGVMLKSCTIDEIIKSVTMVADLPEEELRVRSRKAWEFARANHSREKFLEEYKKFCYQVLRLKSASGESEIENPF